MFGEDLRSTLSKVAIVRSDKLKANVELRDRDKLTTVKYLSTAVNTTKKRSIDAKIFVSKPDSRGKADASKMHLENTCDLIKYEKSNDFVSAVFPEYIINWD